MMEDEEFYHLMLNDLERLHRVRHHIEPPPPPTTRASTRRNSLPVTMPHLHPPVWMSHLREEFKEVVHHGIEAVSAKVAEGRRRSLSWVGHLPLPVPQHQEGAETGK